MTLGIVAQRGNERAAALAEELRDALRADTIDVRVDEATAESLAIPGEPVSAFVDATLVVSIGGDGTFLFTARAVDTTPIIGVNLGEVGFLNVVSPDDAIDVVHAEYRLAASGESEFQQFPRIRARSSEWSGAPALNEILVHAPQRGHGHQIAAEVAIDGESYMTDTVDAVMVSTPIGSTAYNLSERGPLVTPDTGAFVVNLMGGAADMPPLIVSVDATIEITLHQSGRAFMLADGKQDTHIRAPTTVMIEQAPTPVRIAGPPLEFFQALSKLSDTPTTGASSSRHRNEKP